MKQAKIFTLTISIVLFAALSAVAFGPPVNGGPFGVRQLQMMQTILGLTDEQSKDVQNVFTDARKDMAAILQDNNLNRQDLILLRTLTVKLQEEGKKELTTVLTAEEIQAMQEQLFVGNALEFILLSSEDKHSSLQNILGFEMEKANRVVAILEQKKSQHELVLADLGYDTGQIAAFLQDLIAQREKVKQSLEGILSQEQTELFEKIGKNRRQQGHGSFSPFAMERQLL